jgi:hypothetical protein
VETADLDGDGTLSYAEFARALVKETKRVKVIAACKKKRVQLKVVFYALAGDGGRLSAEAAGGRRRGRAGGAGGGPLGLFR